VGPTPPPAAASQQAVGQKRKRPKVETKPRKVVNTTSGGSVRSLSLDYSDESDSDTERPDLEKGSEGRGEPSSPVAKGSLEASHFAADEASSSLSATSPSTPRIKLKLGKAESTPETPDADLGEMAAKMAKKRLRQEEEEEEGGLANLMSGGRPGTPRASKADDPTAKERFANIGTAVKDAGKKIKLNFGFGKKGESKGDGPPSQSAIEKKR
jgi:protein phosphatase-4 regulatory subunit 3